jgi:hypothetical protein
VVARSKAWVCGHLLARMRVRIPQGHRCLFHVNVLCRLVEISASGLSLVQRSPTECGGSECGLENSPMRKPRSTRTVEPLKKYSLNYPSVCLFSLTSVVFVLFSNIFNFPTTKQTTVFVINVFILFVSSFFFLSFNVCHICL